MKRRFPRTLVLVLAATIVSQAAPNGADKIKQGQEAISKSEFPRAIEIFSEVIASDNKNSEAYNGRGVGHLAQNEDQPALADFTEAIRLAPKSSEPYARRAGV